MKRLLLALWFTSFIYSPHAYTHSYPSHWWEAAVGEVAWWEITPDSVEPSSGQVVLSKRNELGLLSNFADTPFILDGIRYNTLEGLWQSMKFPESRKDKRYGDMSLKYSRDEVAQMSGFDAKKAGDYASKLMKKFKINWVTYKKQKMTYRTQKKGSHYKLIVRAMESKLLQNENVRKILKKTGDLVLLPDHKTKSSDPPAWKYFKIWMGLRFKLRTQLE